MKRNERICDLVVGPNSQIFLEKAEPFVMIRRGIVVITARQLAESMIGKRWHADHC